VTLYPGDEFGPGASTEVAAAVARREVEARYVAVVRRELGHSVDEIHVARGHQRIHVTLTIATSPDARGASRLADRARFAVREFDRTTPVVDISVLAAEPSID
jgi:hypothetical protein